MTKLMLLFIAFTSTACAVLEDDAEAPSASTIADDTDDDAGDTEKKPDGPWIRKLEWRWDGCGPVPSLETSFALTLTVFLEIEAHDDYSLKGVADGCDSFTASGQTTICSGFVSTDPRMLTVAVYNKAGDGEESVFPITECAADGT
jgi:hypothetical protein